MTDDGPVTTVRPEPIGTPRLGLVPIEPGHADETAGVLADPALYAFTGGGRGGGGPEPGRRLARWGAALAAG